MIKSMKSIVLLSGGLDSALVLAMAKAEGRDSIALSFDYGQRHRAELRAAEQIASALGAIDHVIASIDPRLLSGSSLTGRGAPPKNRTPDEIGRCVPSTFVFGRNLLFLSAAVALAGARRADEILIGVNEVDCSGYPDCRPEFIHSFARTTRLALGDAVSVCVRAPLVGMKKHEIVREALRIGVDPALALSCYDPSDEGAACGECDACVLRLGAFATIGEKDPARYRSRA